MSLPSTPESIPTCTSTLRVGTLVYATEQGLGYLAKSFYDAGVVTHTLVVRHSHRDNLGQYWYPESREIGLSYLPQERAVAHRLCDSVDVMLFFETPFHWELINYCRSKGVKTVLMPMYECLPPKSLLPYQPDYFICPSLLDLRYFPDANSRFIPVPSNSSVVWRQREKARQFVHNAGHGGLKGRNGTKELLEAMKYVKSPIELLIRSQSIRTVTISDSRVRVEYGSYPYSSLYDWGDVFIFPESFNGLSLPLQEAYASGMLVMTTDRYPMNQWLPKEPLIPVESYRRDRVSGRCVEFDRAVINPRKLAKTIDRWYDADIRALSSSGREWATANSWEVLKPVYMSHLENIVKGSV